MSVSFILLFLCHCVNTAVNVLLRQHFHVLVTVNDLIEDFGKHLESNHECGQHIYCNRVICLYIDIYIYIYMVLLQIQYTACQK